MLVRGFAELTFRDSARLSFARACERVDHDVMLDHPEAWVVDDRRISFSLEMEMTLGELQLHQRIFEELVREARSGEVIFDAEGQERWSRLVGHAASGIPNGRVSDNVSTRESVSMDDRATLDDARADTDVTAVRSGGTRS